MSTLHPAKDGPASQSLSGQLWAGPKQVQLSCLLPFLRCAQIWQTLGQWWCFWLGWRGAAWCLWSRGRAVFQWHSESNNSDKSQRSHLKPIFKWILTPFHKTTKSQTGHSQAMVAVRLLEQHSFLGMVRRAWDWAWRATSARGVMPQMMC